MRKLIILLVAALFTVTAFAADQAQVVASKKTVPAPTPTSGDDCC